LASAQEALWHGVSWAKSGIDSIRSLGDLDPEMHPVRYAGEVRSFDVDALLKTHCDVRLEKNVQMGLVAAQEALVQARLLMDSNDPFEGGNPISPKNRPRAHVEGPIDDDR
jgi:3-oxoacyl-(acyl-carrier-protein) synthase